MKPVYTFIFLLFALAGNRARSQSFTNAQVYPVATCSQDCPFNKYVYRDWLSQAKIN